jgi:hypothetical protein
MRFEFLVGRVVRGQRYREVVYLSLSMKNEVVILSGAKDLSGYQCHLSRGSTNPRDLSLRYATFKMTKG